MRFPLDDELDFYLKNYFLFIKNLTWSRHLFLFYFYRGKQNEKTLSVTFYFKKGRSVKYRIGFEGQVTYREGTVRTVTPL